MLPHLQFGGIMLVKTQEAESGHWYQIDGTPAYRIIGSNGVERNTTLRDARKMGLLVSVTTIISQISRPGLELWKQQQVLMAALTLPQYQGESEKEWLERVMRDSRETGKQAAERGTYIHSVIEAFMEGVYMPVVPEYCREIEKALEARFGNKLWIPEKSFGSKLGFGGKVDLSCRSDDISGFTGAVVDAKTTEKDLTDIKHTFDHAMQLAAYRQGLNMPDADCSILYVNALTNQVKIIDIPQPELNLAWDCFVLLLKFFQIKNKL